MSDIEGHIVHIWGEDHKNGAYWFCDSLAEMDAIEGRKRFVFSPLTENADCLCDIDSLPLETNTVSHAVGCMADSDNVFENIHEIARVLKAEGQCAFIFPNNAQIIKRAEYAILESDLTRLGKVGLDYVFPFLEYFTYAGAEYVAYHCIKRIYARPHGGIKQSTSSRSRVTVKPVVSPKSYRKTVLI